MPDTYEAHIQQCLASGIPTMPKEQWLMHQEVRTTKPTPEQRIAELEQQMRTILAAVKDDGR